MALPGTNNATEALVSRLVRIETLAVEIQGAVALLAEIQAGLALLLVEDKQEIMVFPSLKQKSQHLSAELEAMIQ
jgi:hypothetical protein